MLLLSWEHINGVQRGLLEKDRLGHIGDQVVLFEKVGVRWLAGRGLEFFAVERDWKGLCAVVGGLDRVEDTLGTFHVVMVYGSLSFLGCDTYRRHPFVPFCRQIPL